MACLIKTKYSGKVTWLGRVNLADKGIRSVPMKNADVTFDGILGEAHSGATRPSCVRVTMLHPQGTEIRNSRQITILSAEENAEIAKIMGLEKLDPVPSKSGARLSCIAAWPCEIGRKSYRHFRFSAKSLASCKEPSDV